MIGAWIRLGWHTMITHRLLIILVTGGCLLLGYGYAQIARPVYQATALMQVLAVGDQTVEGQTAAQIALLQSPSTLGKVVETLHLDYSQAIGHMAFIGDFVARHFQPSTTQPLATPPFGLVAYGWGGEQLDVRSLDVPPGLLGETLTMVAGINGRYQLFAPQKVLLLDGVVGQVAQGRGVTLVVTRLTANPGTLLYVSKDRVAVAAQAYRSRLELTPGPNGSGLIKLALRDVQPERARQVLEAITAMSTARVNLLDSPSVNLDEPVSPRLSSVFLLSALLGLLASALLIALRRGFDQGLKNPDSVEAIGLPVFASLPWSQLQKRLNGRGQLLGNVAIHDLAIEALRSLRTSLYFGLLEAPNRTLVLCSPTPDAGASFIASNLATILAQGGQKVLLVDADLRRGRLHEELAVRPANGLADVLAGRMDPDDLITPTLVSGLDLVCSGSVTPDPVSLLNTSQFSELLRGWEPYYDLIIIDTPPLSVGTDAILVGRQAGTLLLVARMGKGSLRDLDTCKQRLLQEGVPVRGAVFNAQAQPTVAKTAPGGTAYGYASASQRK
jgi:capsular exopolysaccharide synthesis family protein